MDRFTNTLFVAVVTEEKVKVISIDAVSGRQSLYTTLTRARRGGNGKFVSQTNCALGQRKPK